MIPIPVRSAVTEDNRVAIVATDSISLSLMRGWPKALADSGGLELHFYANDAGRVPSQREEGLSRYIDVRLERSISPLRDLQAFVFLLRRFRRERYLIVHASTPKAGLLGMVAGATSGVPERIYTIRGLRLESTSDWTWHLLRVAEIVAIRCATQVTVISSSLLHELDRIGLLRHARSVTMFANGSSNGIDTTRFYRVHPSPEAPMRRRLVIPTTSFVLLYVGRLSIDKGIEELAHAWSMVRESVPESMLLVVGQPEDEVGREFADRVVGDPRCRWVGWTRDVRPYYEASDLLVMPSHREGFGNVILEAAAVGVPAVATNVTGCCDAVVDGTTGRLVAVRDWMSLARAIVQLSRSPIQVAAFGAAGWYRAVTDFNQRDLWDAQLAFYRDVTTRGRERRSARRSRLRQVWCAMGLKAPQKKCTAGGTPDQPCSRPSFSSP